jgi:hypothetical protein
MLQLYGKVLWGLAGYLFWPFGQFVKLKLDENYARKMKVKGEALASTSAGKAAIWSMDASCLDRH